MPRPDHAGLLSPLPFVARVYRESLEWIEADDGTYLVAPRADYDEVPVDRPDLAEQFLSLPVERDALRALFDLVGHPTEGIPHRSTGRTRHYFGDRPHVHERDLMGFHDLVTATVRLLSEARRDPLFAGSITQRKTPNRTWSVNYQIGRTALNRSFPEPDDGPIEAAPYDERPLVAVHLAADHLIATLVETHFNLAPAARWAGAYTITHSIHYRPRTVLGSILSQVLEGMKHGSHWFTCEVCGRPTRGRQKARYCGNTCAKRMQRAKDRAAASRARR